MNRPVNPKTIFNYSDLLKVENPDYRHFLEDFIGWQLRMDLGQDGDITSNLVCDQSNSKISAQIIAKESGILAGEEEIICLLKAPITHFMIAESSDINVNFLKSDGANFTKNDIIAKITGQAKAILILERLILNILQRLSGVATQTHNLKQKINSVAPDCQLLATRKTLWGLLDKKAVTVGGGGSHRLSLNQAVMIKDNHWKIIDKPDNWLEKNLTSIEKLSSNISFFEVEVENQKQALRLADKLKCLTDKMPIVIMFDNFSPLMIKKTLEKLRQKNLYDQFLFEASGGINAKNILKYALTGVDALSLGILTSAVENIDMSLEIIL